MSIINNRVKEVRAYANLTQEDFSQRIGISRSNLALIETAKSVPTYETIKKISSEFSIEPGYFFADTAENVRDFIKLPNKGHVNAIKGAPKYAISKTVDIAGSRFNRLKLSESPLHHQLELLRESHKIQKGRLMRELSKQGSSAILEIMAKVESCNTSVNILESVFSNYIHNAPDPSEMEYHTRETDDQFIVELPEKLDYNRYRREFIEYYANLAPYVEAITNLQKSIDTFLDVVKPLDKHQIIS